MTTLRNFLMNGVVFAVPGNGTGGAPQSADEPNDQSAAGETAANNEAGATNNADDAADDTAGDAGANTSGDDGAGDDGAGDDAGGDDVDTNAAGTTDDQPSWKDRELTRKHAQVQKYKSRTEELERENEELRQIAARGGKPSTTNVDLVKPPTTGQQLTQEDIDRAAAAQIAQRDFNNAANNADQDGRKRFAKTWDKATDTLKTLGGFDPETMQGLLATDDPAKVLHELGTKPDEYHRIMDLPPAKRLAEMIKLALPAPKPRNKPSQAAPPVTPVGARTRTGGTELRDDLDDESWYARREAQRAARHAAKTGQRA